MFIQSCAPFSLFSYTFFFFFYFKLKIELVAVVHDSWTTYWRIFLNLLVEKINYTSGTKAAKKVGGYCFALWSQSWFTCRESLHLPAPHVQSGNWQSWDCKLAECWVCMCASFSPCSPGHMPTLFLSISVPFLLSAQCLTPESVKGQTQGIVF